MSSEKSIPCSISLLTLNAADTLPACLDRLRDFEDIIVCDGNSTDATREIAKKYGARVIQQYDSDEPNVPCAMDKATVREKAMTASKLEWRFFMDADDTLSEEAVNEIRTLVTQKNPAHRIYRMPTRIFIDGREILHEATYPSYQTRLVHASVQARFKGPVHDHLVWDRKKFPVGTMQNYYNFEWSKERVANYWKYVNTYVWRELRTMQIHRSSLADFLYWGIYRRARIGFGYILWRLPTMYAQYGFRDSMPLKLELQIAAQHFYILFASIALFVASRPSYIRLLGTLRGEDSDVTERNIAIREWEAYGRLLDIADERGSYWDYLQTHRWHRDAQVSHANLAKVPKRHFDTVLAFGLILTEEAAKNVRAVLREGGAFIGNARDNPTSLLETHGFTRVDIISLSGHGYVYRAISS